MLGVRRNTAARMDSNAALHAYSLYEANCPTTKSFRCARDLFFRLIGPINLLLSYVNTFQNSPYICYGALRDENLYAVYLYLILFAFIL